MKANGASRIFYMYDIGESKLKRLKTGPRGLKHTLLKVIEVPSVIFIVFSQPCFYVVLKYLCHLL